MLYIHTHILDNFFFDLEGIKTTTKKIIIKKLYLDKKKSSINLIALDREHERVSEWEDVEEKRRKSSDIARTNVNMEKMAFFW